MSGCEVVACARGVAQHAPDLAERVARAGAQFSTVECFDRCDTCERALLVRINGALLRCTDPEDVAAAIAALAEG
jgi:uncharacterized protein YuzB (UPF0349 family)